MESTYYRKADQVNMKKAEALSWVKCLGEQVPNPIIGDFGELYERSRGSHEALRDLYFKFDDRVPRYKMEIWVMKEEARVKEEIKDLENMLTGRDQKSTHAIMTRLRIEYAKGYLISLLWMGEFFKGWDF